MSLYEKLKAKKSFVYRVGNEYIAVYRDKFVIIRFDDRVEKLKKILDESNDVDEIKKSFNKLSMIAELNLRNNTFKLKDYIISLKDNELADLKKELDLHEAIYKNYINQ